MAAFLLYILKTSLCLTLFYVFFKALLSKDTFFRLNRFLLLGGMLGCHILPLIEYRTEAPTFFQQPILKLEEAISQPLFFSEPPVQPPVPDTNNNAHTATVLQPEHTLLPGNFLFYLYCTGAVVSFILFLMSVFRIVRIIQHSFRMQTSKYILYLTNEAICPFSIGKYIVLSDADYQNHPNEILIHEQIHVQKKHTVDLFLIQILALFHWFNPVIWLLKRELREIHEYEADLGVLNKGIDATKYQLLLVKKAVGSRRYTIANSFNHSKIKNRITMMLKEKSTRWARLKPLLLVPLAAGMLQAFARPEINRQLESLTASESTTILQESEKWTEEYFDNAFNKFIKAESYDPEKMTEKELRDFCLSIRRDGFQINRYGDIILSETVISPAEVKERIKKMFSSIGQKNTKWVAVFLTVSPAAPKDKVREIFNLVGEAYNDERKALATKHGNDDPTFLDSKLPVLVLVNKKNLFIAPWESGTPPPPPPPAPALKIEYYEGDKMAWSYLYSFMQKDIDFSKITKVKIVTLSNNPEKAIELAKDYLNRYYKGPIEYSKK